MQGRALECSNLFCNKLNMKNGDIVGSDKIPQSEAEQSSLSLCHHQRPGSSGEWWLERRQTDCDTAAQIEKFYPRKEVRRRRRRGRRGWGEMDSLRPANS